MPVFTRLQDGVLVVVVDGDYTADGLRRAGVAGLNGEGVPHPVPVLVDMSGAAGLSNRPTSEIRETGAFFAQHAERMTRVAVLGPSDLAYGMMNIGSVFASAGGLHTQAFRTRSEAMEWLVGEAH